MSTADDTPSEVGTEPGATGSPSTVEAPAAQSISRRRLILVDGIIVVSTILAVVGILAIFANRLLFNPANWEQASTQLLQNDAIRTATANYVVDQIYANVDVAGLLKSGLPPRFQPLAGPAAGALQNAATDAVKLLLTRPRIQTLWARANRAADETLVSIVNGGKGAVNANNGVVSLNLASIVDQVATRLGLPADLSSKLPPDVANLKIFKSDQLKLVQNGGKAIRGLALWLTILVPLLWLLAIFLARGHRRRTLMTVGFAIIVAGVIGLAGRSILKNQVTNSLVQDATLRPASLATLDIATSILRTIAQAFIVVGLVVVLSAWFAGPAKLATSGRRAIAPFMREHAAATFAIVAVVMILIFIWQPIPATGTPAGIIVFMALALFGTEMLRRQAATEFPDAQRGQATAAVRARMHAMRESRQRARAPIAVAAPESLPEQLERLAEMRDAGKISVEDYDAAKAALLRPQGDPSADQT